MGNKSRAERKAGHDKFQQRLTARENNAPIVLTNDEIRIAAEFLISSDPKRAADATMLSEKVLSNIANGRFSPSVNQGKHIERVARADGWTPPTNG